MPTLQTSRWNQTASSDAKAECPKDLKPSVEELELLLHEVWGRLQDLRQTLQAATRLKLRGWIITGFGKPVPDFSHPFCTAGRLYKRVPQLLKVHLRLKDSISGLNLNVLFLIRHKDPKA